MSARWKSLPRNLVMGDVDHIRIAVAIAKSARWIGATSIAISVALVASLFMGRPLHTLAALALSLAILAGAAVVYLMVRVELDRTIFEAADSPAYFAGFDQSRAQLGLGQPPSEARPVADRVQGLIGIVRSMGYLFVVELFFALAGFWMARWLS